jgi:2-dehydropantoate 2-reductase
MGEAKRSPLWRRPSAPIRNIVVVGIGGIGGVVGARLALRPSGTGRHLTFVARGAHLQAIRAGGLRLARPDGSSVVAHPELATDRLEEAPAPDLAVLCVKSYDLDAVAGRLAAVLAPSTVVLSLLNGADIRERLRARLPIGIVPPACIYVSARRLAPGSVEHVGGACQIHLGPDPEVPGWDGRELRAVLQEAGIPFRWHSDATVAIWVKYMFIAPFALVTAAHGADFGRVLTEPGLEAQVRAVMEEIQRIAEVRGVLLPADIVESTLRTAAGFPPETRTSYQRDIESRAPADEGDLYGGAILRLGSQHGVPTPVSAELAAAIARLRG